MITFIYIMVVVALVAALLNTWLNDETPPTAFTPSQLLHSHESRKDP